MAVLFIDPGALRTELVLEACTAVPDGLGGFSETWTETAALFAKIEPVSAESVFGADQTLETMTHRITLRHRDGVASGMRFTKGDRTFAINCRPRSGRERPLSGLQGQGDRRMKLATAVTLDGLVRALRWNAHDLAEAVEAGYASSARELGEQQPARQAPRPTREQDDDRAGR